MQRKTLHLEGYWLRSVTLAYNTTFNTYILHEGFDTLLTRDITQSSAMQRTGRAGREVSSI